MRRAGGTIVLSVLVAVAIISKSFAVNQAIWDVYPKLICSYGEAQFCDTDLRNCTNDVGKAVLEFDFGKNQIRTFSTSQLLPIDSRYHRDLDSRPTADGNASEAMNHYAGDFDTNSVFATGALYSFVRVKKSQFPSQADTVEGTMQSAIEDDIFTVHMTCHPE